MQADRYTPARVCAVVLAGGQGSRMGGVDKGLQPYLGRALALQALTLLGAQAGGAPGLLAINANRNLPEYRAWGYPVWSDPQSDYPGPLAGFATALAHAGAEHDFVLTVPCDSPRFPTDLLARLAQGLLQAQADIAMPLASEAAPQAPAQSPGHAPMQLRLQPVFCLMRTRLGPDLQRFMASGQRKIENWARQHALAQVRFDLPQDDPNAFANANSLAELQQLERL